MKKIQAGCRYLVFDKFSTDFLIHKENSKLIEIRCLEISKGGLLKIEFNSGFISWENPEKFIIREELPAQMESSLAEEFKSNVLSIKDKFALQAISIFRLTNEDMKSINNGFDIDYSRIAKICYGLAGAMERERKDRLS